jgi:N6-adenosine-specific RNA methylase IME4
MSAANDCTLDALVGRGFDLLVSDPPWPVKKIVRKVRPNQVAALDYPTMTLDEIKAMPVTGCAADKAVLFLWTTHAFLRDAFDVMDAYGFRYQRTLTWDKANGMCLFGFHHRTEFCLFGYRGKIEMYPRRKAIPTVFSGKSERHSAKPDEFYRMVEPLGSNRLDIFARRARPGWTVWGNEVEANASPHLRGCSEAEPS